MLRGSFGDDLANVSVEIEHMEPRLTGIAKQDIVIEPPRPGAWSLIGKRVQLVHAAGTGASDERGHGLSAPAGQLRPAESSSPLVIVGLQLSRAWGYNSADYPSRRKLLTTRPPEQDDHPTAREPPAPSDLHDDGCDSTRRTGNNDRS
jgi:hypothetical protein